MCIKVETVALESIDTTDETYRITTRESIEDLAASLETVGLLNAPCLQLQKPNFTVICGFRRIAAARKLHMHRIDARIVQPKDVLTAVRLAVADNISQRELNPIEISRSLQLLSTACENRQLMLDTAAQLGLPHNPTAVDNLIGLCRLSLPFQNAILAGLVSPSVANRLAVLEPADRDLLVGLFVDLKVGLNKQREILTILTDITARDGCTIEDVFHKADIIGIRANTKMDRVLKTRLIRQNLKQIRFPAVQKAAADFEKNRKKLNIGGQIRLEPPEHFEGSAYRLDLRFRNQAELRQLNNRIARMLDDPDIDSVIPK